MVRRSCGSSMSPRSRRRRRCRNKVSPRRRGRHNKAKKKAAKRDKLIEFLEKLNKLQELKYNEKYGHTCNMGERYGYNAGLGFRVGGVEQAWRDYCQITPSAWLNKHSKLVFEHAFERGFQSGADQRQCDADGDY